MNPIARIAMILSNILSSATSLSISGSGKLSEMAKLLAPAARVAMERLRGDDEFCLKLSTVLVAIGVILEYFEISHELREKTGPFKIHRPEMPKWMLYAGFAGWLMIVVGVVGEFVFESAVSTWSEQLESLSNGLLGDAQITAAEATKEAGDAADSAQKAQNAADGSVVAARVADTRARDAEAKVRIVAHEADDVSAKLDKTSARLKGHAFRFELLRDAEPEFDGIARYFAPQNFGVTYCGTFDNSSPYAVIPKDLEESEEAGGDLSRILSNAGWIQQDVPLYWSKCDRTSGITVFVERDLDGSKKGGAAHALGETLFAIFGRQYGSERYVISCNETRPEDLESPCGVIAKHPDWIVVLFSQKVESSYNLPASTAPKTNKK